MSFEQEIITSVLNGLASAVAVTVLGGVVVWRLTHRWETRREDYELRTRLLDRAARVAQEMFTTCQHTRRLQHAARTSGVVNVLEPLDTAYLKFSTESAALETVLGARFGVSWMPAGQATGETPNAETPANVFWRWHQIRDLLTAYYFNLKGDFPGDALQQNSIGSGGKFHSGLDLVRMMKPDDLSREAKLRAMRTQIRRQYDVALADLATSMIKDPIRSA